MTFFQQKPAFRVQARNASSRGSMLIMVVVILVLLALIGTAMISTARLDRVNIAQHSANTQIDLLVESIKNVAIGKIVDDLFSGGQYRPSADAPGTYKHLDATTAANGNPAFLGDGFLSSRLPSIAGPEYGWTKLTEPMLGSMFESPARGNLLSVNYLGQVGRAIRSINIGQPDQMPGLLIEDLPGIGPSANDRIALAADADGEGIADSGLFRIPIGELNGVAYYAAVRVVDHNSAINASTAWNGQTDFDFTGAATDNHGYFPTNVGLMELLAVTTEINQLNRYRFNLVAATPAVGATPVDDTGVNRGDFAYLTQGDAVTSQLARRLENPGNRSGAIKYQALPVGESATMASRFCLISPAASASVLERSPIGGLPASLYKTNANIKSVPYKAQNFAAWYSDNFDFNQANRPLRALVTARSGVSNAAPAHDITQLDLGRPAGSGYLTTTNQSDRMPSYNRSTEVVPKTSINTAPFNTLWRAYWNVMCVTPTTAPATGQFRSPLRDPQATPTQTMQTFETMMLRSAMAALNAIDLRDSDYHVTTRKIKIYDALDNTQAAPKYDVTLYGSEPQPFITEVYAHTDNLKDYGTGLNPRGYVAVELHNPYPFAISLKNWQLARVYRQATGVTGATVPTYPTMKLTKLTNFAGFGTTAPPVIPANGYLVLENFPNGATPADPLDALSRPPEVGAPPLVYYVPSLHEVLGDPLLATENTGGELVVLRPRRAILNTGTNTLENDFLCQSAAGETIHTFNENQAAPNNLVDLVPVDQYDFTGLATPLGSTVFVAWHYVRQNGPNNLFKFVYPGGYTAINSGGVPRQGGTQISTWDPVAVPPAPQVNVWETVPPVPGIGLGTADTASSYVNLIPAIQWHNVDQAGTNKTTAATGNRFPFGGFLRNADIAMVPFFGSYRVRLMANTDPTVFLELNAAPVDSSLVENGDNTDDAWEMLGRCIPLSASNPTAVGASYDWARDLLDYLAVSAPSDDYFPNVDSSPADAVVLSNGSTSYLSPTSTASRYPGTSPDATKNTSLYVAADTRTNTIGEQLVPTEGLINLNTASIKTLSAVPWLNGNLGVDRLTLNTGTGLVTAGANGVPDNAEIARIIVAWRDGDTQLNITAHGPFTSLFDLNKIVLGNDPTKGFQNAFGLITAEPDDGDGDVSPAGQGTADGVRDDAEERTLMLSRVSNLLSLRSDVFTVYVLVQGYRNAGSAAPELVVQRRTAVIVDRNNISPTNRSPSVISVPTE